VRQKRRWAPPGWPWELELLALIFVLTAIIIPYYLQYTSTPDYSELSLYERTELERKAEVGGSWWGEATDFMWAVAIVCLYLAHLVMAGASISFVSTPFTHLVAPLLFSGITYYRLLRTSSRTSMETPLVQGTAFELSIWVLGVVVITFLVARVRMARHLINFRDVQWEISTPTVWDRSFSQLALRFQPLVYPPRVYRASDEGLIIEGWMYVLPIPFSLMQNIDRVPRAGLLSAGYYLATSTHNLIRIKLTESPEPIFISPQDVRPLLTYCQQHVTAMKPDTRSVEAAVEIEE